MLLDGRFMVRSDRNFK